MIKSLIIGGILLLLGVVLISCKEVQTPILKSIENVKINRLGMNNSSVSFSLQYFNPNKFQLKLKKAEGDAWLDGNSLGHFTMDSLTHISANSDFYLPVNLNLDMKYFVQNMAMAYLNKLANLKLEGTARVGKGFFYINYPLRFEGKVDLKTMIK